MTLDEIKEKYSNKRILISYNHPQDPNGIRFAQYYIEPFPPWAINIHVEELDKDDVS